MLRFLVPVHFSRTHIPANQVKFIEINCPRNVFRLCFFFFAHAIIQIVLKLKHWIRLVQCICSHKTYEFSASTFHINGKIANFWHLLWNLFRNFSSLSCSRALSLMLLLRCYIRTRPPIRMKSWSIYCVNFHKMYICSQQIKSISNRVIYYEKCGNKKKPTRRMYWMFVWIENFSMKSKIDPHLSTLFLIWHDIKNTCQDEPKCGVVHMNERAGRTKREIERERERNHENKSDKIK